MIPISIDLSKKDPMYLQIYGAIRSEIEKKELKAHEKLPSKRNLAIHLGVSLSTVQTAYAHLLGEGYIYTKEKVGYFVNELDLAVHPTTLGKSMSPINESAPSEEILRPHYAKEDALRRRPSLKTSPEEYLPVTTRVAAKLFPYSTWSQLMRKTLRHSSQHYFQDMPSMGLYDLREAIAQHVYKFCGLQVSPQQIFIGAGSEYLYGLLVKLLQNPKDMVVEDPGYPKIRQIYEAEGVTVHPIAIDDQGLSSKGLRESGHAIVHVSPSHNFPSGVYMSIARRLELLSWLDEDDQRYIIEDDFDSEFCWQNKPVAPLYALRPNDRVIYMNTFSKTISPALRMSYMILPMHLVERYEKYFGFYACTVSYFQQHTLAAFIKEGYFERHINRMKKYYREIAKDVQRCMEPFVKDGRIVLANNVAGLFVTLALPKSPSMPTLRHISEQEQLHISFLEDYYSRPYEEVPKIIINYDTVDLERLQYNLRRLLHVPESIS